MNNKIINKLLKEANKAYKKEEIPVGALIVCNDKIISCGHNTKQKTHIPTNHAEIIAINKACKKIRDWRLDDCELYVTLEPCGMCKEVIRQSRIKKVYYLINSNFNNENKKEIHYINIKSDDQIANNYKNMLQAYFKGKR